MMSSATSRSSLPSGLAVLTTFPDVLFIPELVSASFPPQGGQKLLVGHPARWVLQVSQGWVLPKSAWSGSQARFLSHKFLGAA